MPKLFQENQFSKILKIVENSVTDKQSSVLKTNIYKTIVKLDETQVQLLKKINDGISELKDVLNKGTKFEKNVIEKKLLKENIKGKIEPTLSDIKSTSKTQLKQIKEKSTLRESSKDITKIKDVKDISEKFREVSKSIVNFDDKLENSESVLTKGFYKGLKMLSPQFNFFVAEFNAMKDVVSDSVDKFKEFKDASSKAKDELKGIAQKGKDTKDVAIDKLTKVIKKNDIKQERLFSKIYRETENQGDLKQKSYIKQLKTNEILGKIFRSEKEEIKLEKRNLQLEKKSIKKLKEIDRNTEPSIMGSIFGGEIGDILQFYLMQKFGPKIFKGLSKIPGLGKIFEKFGGKIFKEGGKSAAKKVSKEVADSGSKKILKEATQAVEGKAATSMVKKASSKGFFGGLKKIGGKIAGKGLRALKGIPGVGSLVSAGFLVSDLLQGNFASAAMDALGMIPGLGTIATIADIGMAATGIDEKINESVKGTFSKEKPNEVKNQIKQKTKPSLKATSKVKKSSAFKKVLGKAALPMLGLASLFGISLGGDEAEASQVEANYQVPKELQAQRVQETKDNLKRLEETGVIKKAPKEVNKNFIQDFLPPEQRKKYSMAKFGITEQSVIEPLVSELEGKNCIIIGDINKAVGGGLPSNLIEAIGLNASEIKQVSKPIIEPTTSTLKAALIKQEALSSKSVSTEVPKDLIRTKSKTTALEHSPQIPPKARPSSEYVKSEKHPSHRKASTSYGVDDYKLIFVLTGGY